MDKFTRFESLMINIIIYALLWSVSEGYVRLDSTPVPVKELGPTKVEFHNVTFEELNLKNINEDITFLRISNSKIERIDKSSFVHFKHLNFLELSDDYIVSGIHPQTFSGMPGLEILILKNVGLRKVELNLTNVQELILAKNDIEELTGEKILAENLRYLDVNHNRIKSLTNSLESLEMLSVIDLSRNGLTYIDPKVFTNNINLEKILAAENRISSTESLKLPWLKTLDLFSNGITSLPSDSLSGMKSLEELVLAFNYIKTLEDPFKDLTELKFLNLAWNQLTELRPDLFRNNLYLTSLSLQGNRLKSLTRFSRTLPHLFYLDLSHNNLELINDDFFTSLPSLTDLNLSFNKLKTVTDSLGSLTSLRVLDLAQNELIMSGYELSRNTELTRVNLSSNALELGLSIFKNNMKLNIIDVSHNVISNFCDASVPFKNLKKVNVRGNQIKSLMCLKDKNMRSLCEVDLRHNPLTCGDDFDDVVLSLALKRGAPYQTTAEHHSDISQSQCLTLSLNKSIAVWNAVKQKICPRGVDLKLKANNDNSELSSVEQIESSEESEEENLKAEPTQKTFNVVRNPLILVPIAWVRKDHIKAPPVKSQSERLSWEQIDQNPEILNGLEEEESKLRKSHFSWFTIALLLIVLSLTLTCVNIIAFLCIRHKVWKKVETKTPQKYTILQNEIYRNTTEPSPVNPKTDSEWSLENQTRNKMFSYGKINEFLLNFGSNKKNKDTESVQNILISPNTQSS